MGQQQDKVGSAMEGRKDNQISKAGYNQETYYLAHVVQNVVVRLGFC